MTSEREQLTPLSDADVAYLYRAIKSDITSMRNRIQSLVNHLDGVDKSHLELANRDLLTVSAHVTNAEKITLREKLPHRLNDGEDPAW
jgi:hypothetical protein